MPLSMETASEGKLHKFQSLIYTGSPSVPTRLYLSDIGIPSSSHILLQLSTSFSLYAPYTYEQP